MATVCRYVMPRTCRWVGEGRNGWRESVWGGWGVGEEGGWRFTVSYLKQHPLPIFTRGKLKVDPVRYYPPPPPCVRTTVTVHRGGRTNEVIYTGPVR